MISNIASFHWAPLYSLVLMPAKFSHLKFIFSLSASSHHFCLFSINWYIYLPHPRPKPSQHHNQCYFAQLLDCRQVQKNGRTSAFHYQKVARDVLFSSSHFQLLSQTFSYPYQTCVHHTRCVHSSGQHHYHLLLQR